MVLMVFGEAENPCFFELVAAGEEGNGGVDDQDEDDDGHCQLDQLVAACENDNDDYAVTLTSLLEVL